MLHYSGLALVEFSELLECGRVKSFVVVILSHFYVVLSLAELFL